KIVLGDEIVSVNGMAIDQSRRLILAGQEHRRHLFFVQVDPEEEIEVEYRRRQNSELQTVVLQAREAIPAEDVIEISARVIESEGNRYGYIRYWNLMSVKTTELSRDVIEEQFDDCHMLILDLRGRGGLIPVVLSMEKLIRRTDVPVIAVTDNLTRSAKEMLSWLIKDHPHVTVVGERTAGAVTGATMTQLPSGNGLMYPALSSENLKGLTGDVILEGVGVEPDIQCDFQIPWCGGNDRLLEAAIETADEQIEELLRTII
ncbi:MAG: S41 family peptidase, partial [Pirellulaceae bacterium]